MPRYGGEELRKRIKQSQELYKQGVSLDDIAEKFGVSRATAYINALGFTDHGMYRAVINDSKRVFAQKLSECLERIGRLEIKIKNTQTTKKGIRVFIDSVYKNEDVDYIFRNNFRQSIIYSGIEELNASHFKFIYRLPELTIFPVPISGSISPLIGRAFLEAYAETVLKRQTLDSPPKENPENLLKDDSV